MDATSPSRWRASVAGGDGNALSHNEHGGAQRSAAWTNPTQPFSCFVTTCTTHRQQSTERNTQTEE